eukprot:250089-Hanusia_phi.AAC.2
MHRDPSYHQSHLQKPPPPLPPRLPLHILLLLLLLLVLVLALALVFLVFPGHTAGEGRESEEKGEVEAEEQGHPAMSIRASTGWAW